MAAKWTEQADLLKKLKSSMNEFKLENENLSEKLELERLVD
jgi:hypothetical protein